jgi:putative ABC transport system substrate-binding protein
MQRREFITALAGAAMAGGRPFAARAQQGGTPTIGFLRVTSAADSAHLAAAFREGLKESGFIDGQNIRIEARYGEGHRDRLPVLIGELLARHVAMIATDQAVHAVKAATSSVPTIFVLGADPVTTGLVKNLNHPGGNVTGIVFFSSQLGAKRIELLRQLVPKAAAFGVLAYSASPEDRTEFEQVKTAAATVGQRLVVAEVTRDDELEQAFATFASAPVGAVLVGSGPFFRSHKERIIGLAARTRLPASYSLREYADHGGLMSYGASITEAYRQAGLYAARIVKGQNPGDLPVMQSTKFELVINLKTARALGLVVPESLLLAADDVIE